MAVMFPRASMRSPKERPLELARAAPTVTSVSASAVATRAPTAR
jgi:hypothetical protein